MDLDVAVAERYLVDALAQLLAVAQRVGDDGVNEQPHGPGTNSVAALVAHCCGLTEWWLGHLAGGLPTDRDRAAEFSAAATLDELRALVARTSERAREHLARLAAGAGRPVSERRTDLPTGPGDASIVLHVLEELYQHLGHAEVTADALVGPPGT